MEKNTKGLLSLCLRQLKKIHRVSIALMLLMALVVNVQASSYSESVKFDLKMNKVSLKKVFQTITEQSEFKFIYNNDVVNDNQKVTVSTTDARVEEILDEILPQHKLAYKIIDRQVIVFPEEEKSASPGTSTSVGQQERTISGTVTDEDGAPLPGVSVVVKGTTTGIVTDVDGNYSLEIPDDARTLVFSFVGMRTQEVAIGNRTNINVTLETEAIGLEEVIAVGYASQKKANIVGSVTSISGEKIESIPSSDVTNALSGRMPGSVVIQGSGEPGQTSARILVRGRTTLGDNTGPLVVVDGIPGRSLGDIDPVDIESISVLKDASAAIYGATAANGVILVTTKQGQTGKPQLSYQF
jgi:TonB-dependent SusC/RagA subfamily outer membrane receptor